MTTFDPSGRGHRRGDDPIDNISQLRPPLLDRAKRLLDRISPAAEIPPVLDYEYVVKGWLHRGSVSVVFGDSNVGKSFWAVDIAHHVQQGLEWSGNRVGVGQVLYVAAEGGTLFANRLSAAGARFLVLQDQVTLAGRNTDAPSLVQAVQELEDMHGPFVLIVFDTLARVMGGADENTAPDIGSLMKSIDLIREKTGAHCMLIHHSGKDAARGARGHSSLRAAVDTEIELSKDEAGVRIARATKQRDLPVGREDIFELEVVTLGRDRDGDEVTSCRVNHKGGSAR